MKCRIFLYFCKKEKGCKKSRDNYYLDLLAALF